MTKTRVKMINATKWAGSVILTLGIIIFSYGFVSDFSSMAGIGLGTAAGAIFIFLMGMFFVATEEMVENTFKGIKITPIKLKQRKGAPY